MIKLIKSLFTVEKLPRKGLFPFEWAVLAYAALTLLVIFFTYTKLSNPEALIGGRIRVLIITMALWGLYRMRPCRFFRMLRVLVQMILLSWWYPDTYELNRIFPNLDHLFASAEQWFFGCQPALLFHEKMPWAIFSEVMNYGYVAYYPMIAVVLYWYFFCRYHEFERASFIVLAAFFIYYVIFIFVPVAGPMFYFQAIGLDKAAQGIFPNIGLYFNSHTECLATPGWADGWGYYLVDMAHQAGERPTAAFPSSHVGLSTVAILLAWRTRSKRLLYWLLPFYVSLCFSTVYIQAHYAIDAIMGFVTGVIIYLVLLRCTRFLVEKPASKRHSKQQS